MSASSGDRILLFCLLALVAVAASASPIRSYDYWWHLKTGEMILQDRRVPRVDPFSFTASGVPWVDHEWLFQVLAFIGHTWLGPAALVGLKIALSMLLAFLMAAHVRQEGNPVTATTLLPATALVGSSFRLDVRPELATLLLLPLILHLALRARDGRRHSLLLAVPLLAALGANLHPGAVLAPAILLIGAGVTFIDERLRLLRHPGEPAQQPRPPFAGRLAATAVAAAIACGANPSGFRIYAVPFQVSGVLATLPSPNLEWARPQPADFPLFYLAAVAALVILAMAWRSVDPLASPALLLLLALACMHLRNIGLFFVLLPYGLARPVRALAQRMASTAAMFRRSPAGEAAVAAAGARVRPGFVVSAVALISAVPLLALVPPKVAWGLGISSGNEPAGAADFVARENLGRRLYNDVRFGGYLIWRRFPAHRVFIDGRNEVYPELLRDVFASSNDSRAWRDLLRRYDIDAAFVRFMPSLERVTGPAADGGPGRVQERAFSVNHFPPEDWALVYWDDDAMIFARRSEENLAVIARSEYRAIQPEDWRYQVAGVVTGHIEVGPILEELQRKLREDPRCIRAWALMRTFKPLAEARRSQPGAPASGG